MEENADNPMNQELLVAGHLIQMLLKVCIDRVSLFYPLTIIHIEFCIASTNLLLYILYIDHEA